MTESTIDQSGDIAPIINKAEAEKSLIVSPDWEKELRKYLKNPESHVLQFDEGLTIFDLISFISQLLEKAKMLARMEGIAFMKPEVEKAREEGRQEGESKARERVRPVVFEIKEEERQRIVKLIEGMEDGLPLIESFKSTPEQLFIGIKNVPGEFRILPMSALRALKEKLK